MILGILALILIFMLISFELVLFFNFDSQEKENRIITRNWLKYIINNLKFFLL